LLPEDGELIPPKRTAVYGKVQSHNKMHESGVGVYLKNKFAAKDIYKLRPNIDCPVYDSNVTVIHRKAIRRNFPLSVDNHRMLFLLLNLLGMSSNPKLCQAAAISTNWLSIMFNSSSTVNHSRHTAL
jgi:hypothetical protein